MTTTPNKPKDRATQTDSTSAVECPACAQHVPEGSIDLTALSVEARNDLTRSQIKGRYKSDRAAIDKMRAEKAKRIRSSIGDE